MKFETKREVLDWYEGQERALTDEFIGGIAWHEVKNHPLDERLVPVLLYMRDIEILTDMYHEELRHTPTGKDSIISKFMERWGIEEITHGELINRFLNEAGIETPAGWKEKISLDVSGVYNFYTRILTALTNCVGESFTATHMSYGAINELCAAQAYRRMIDIADHPVLTHILKGIIREEAVHTQFYYSVARLELKKSNFARNIARFIVKNFWRPVGSGARPDESRNYAIAMLFGDDEGVEWIDRTVTGRVQKLPGFDGITKVTDKIAEIGINTKVKLQTELAKQTLSLLVIFNAVFYFNRDLIF